MILTEQAPPAEQIAEQVNEVLTSDDKLSAGDVWIHVEDDVVTLAGTVSDEASALRAEQLVQEIPAVQTVDNLLESVADRHENGATASPESNTTPRTAHEELREQKAGMTNEGGPPPDLPTPANG